MRSQLLVRSYLESLIELTQAASANLYIPANTVQSTELQVVQLGEDLLTEFTDPEYYFSKLNSTESQFHACGCAVVFGSTAHSVLVALRTTKNNEPEGSSAGSSRRSSAPSENVQVYSWLGLGFIDEVPTWLIELSEGKNDGQEEQQLCKLFKNLIDFGAMQLGQIESNNALLNDPLTSLPCRTKFQSEVAQLYSQFPYLAVLMVHSSDFHHINKKFSHESGDKVIWEIAQNLRNSIRETDLVSRFGGALFAVAVPINQEQEAVALAQKIQHSLQKPEYLGGAISLSFNVGIGAVNLDEHFDSLTQRVAGLINKADQALKASQTNAQPTISLWQLDQIDIYNQRIDYIGGIFTADTATDYRNMLLLWDISNIIASKNQFDELLQQVVQRLGQTFDFLYAGIVEYQNDEQIAQKKVYLLNDEAQASQVEKLPAITDTQVMQIANSVAKTNKPQHLEDEHLALFAAPLNGEGKSCFFITSGESALSITNDSQMLFAALSKQLGRALNRTRLEEQLNQQLQQQKQQLQHELEQLKQDLQSSSMFYCSSAMEQLMKQAKRAAATDTTTLIIGESGTGKERLVNALHKMGTRKDKPLIIVDCGAIPETLIESELFGHVKGAFTGAQNSNTGKVLEADGGTLMLDEIGELPLQMQTKLLRFVQEKHFTPVGGTKSESVDVKIIAVTNRELEQEVEKGNFRQDLFYRLNVLTLRTPPLRERPEDITLLSKHFLKKFSQQFSHSVKRLSESASRCLMEYNWPGNIRELENRLMQANLLCDGDVIEWQDLKIDLAKQISLPDAPQALNTSETIPLVENQTSQTHFSSQENKPHTEPRSTETVSKSQCLNAIQQVLASQIADIINKQDVMHFPVGRWLEEDLIFLTYKALNDSVKMAGLRLGISHSTLRRKIDKIIHQKQIQNESRPDTWEQVLAALAPIAHGDVFLGTDCFMILKLTLLDVVLSQSPHNMSIAAVLMSVSEPTLYKLKKQLAKEIESQKGLETSI